MLNDIISDVNSHIQDIRNFHGTLDSQSLSSYDGKDNVDTLDSFGDDSTVDNDDKMGIVGILGNMDNSGNRFADSDFLLAIHFDMAYTSNFTPIVK